MSTGPRDILRVLDERRRALRMPVRVIAKRAGIAKSTAARVLAGDTSAGFTTVASIADALGMELRARSTKTIAGILRREAKMHANRVVGMVQGTSGLEGQAVGRSALDTMIEREAADVMSRSGRKLWPK